MRGQACADKGLVEEGGEWWRCVWWRDAVWLVNVAGECVALSVASWHEWSCGHVKCAEEERRETELREAREVLRGICLSG